MNPDSFFSLCRINRHISVIADWKIQLGNLVILRLSDKIVFRSNLQKVWILQFMASRLRACPRPSCSRAEDRAFGAHRTGIGIGLSRRMRSDSRRKSCPCGKFNMHFQTNHGLILFSHRPDFPPFVQNMPSEIYSLFSKAAAARIIFFSCRQSQSTSSDQAPLTPYTVRIWPGGLPGRLPLCEISQIHLKRIRRLSRFSVQSVKCCSESSIVSGKCPVKCLLDDGTGFQCFQIICIIIANLKQGQKNSPFHFRSNPSERVICPHPHGAVHLRTPRYPYLTPSNRVRLELASAEAII